MKMWQGVLNDIHKPTTLKLNAHVQLTTACFCEASAVSSALEYVT